ETFREVLAARHCRTAGEVLHDYRLRGEGEPDSEQDSWDDAQEDADENRQAEQDTGPHQGPETAAGKAEALTDVDPPADKLLFDYVESGGSADRLQDEGDQEQPQADNERGH